MKVQNEKSAVKRAGVRSAIAGAVGSRWRYAIAGAVSVWRRLAASGQLVGAFERQAAAESAEWQAKMSRAGRIFKAAPAAPAAPAPAPGAGAMAAAMAAAGVVVNPARREVGAECQTIGALLHGVERPAGPLLQAWQDSIQVPNDLKMCSAFAGRFNSKMIGDGRESLWLHHERGDGWAVTMADAIRDGIFALYRWRAGQSLVRDDSGADVLAVGDSFGEHSSAVVRRVIPQVWSADESEQAAIDSYCGGNWALPVVTYEVSSIASRIAWRALVQSVARDTMGESPAQLRFARDYFEWATGARDWRGLTVEQRRARRLATVDFRFEQLAAGRGQRVKMAGKSKQATVLMLSGMDGEQAAASAGFKSSPYQGSSGARSSLNRMADALKRAGLPVVSRRGNFAQVQAGDFSYTYRPLWGEIGGVIMGLGVRRAAIEITSNRLGGAVKDLAGASVFYAHPTFKQFNFARAKRRLMAGVLSYPFEPRMLPAAPATAAAMAAARVNSPLSKSVSGLGLPVTWQNMVASDSVELSSLPALPGQLRRAVAAFNRRKFKGVLRAKAAPAPAAPAPAKRRRVLRFADSGKVFRGYAPAPAPAAPAPAPAAPAPAAPAAPAAAAFARRCGAGLSSSVELRQFKFCPLIKSGPLEHGQWFAYRSLWGESGAYLGLVRV